MADLPPAAAAQPHPNAVATATADANATIATALQALSTAITQFNANNAAAAANAPALLPGNLAGTQAGQPLIDPFASPLPFDLYTRAGDAAYKRSCRALTKIWDGSPTTLPSFVIALRVHSAEVNWDAPAPQGILTYGPHNLLTDYYSITEATLDTARAARTDARAGQNAKAMYECLKESITGKLRATLFDQSSNLMVYADGPLFFKKMLSFTPVASLQLSMLSFQQILQFDPAVHNFVVPTVNTKLNHLFILATTSARTLANAEKIQHTLTAYQRIKQPEIWAQWVRNQIDNFEAGTITVCQTFMNYAVMKYNKICIEHGGNFPGSASTIQEDIVAMVAASSVKRKKSPSKSDSKAKTDNTSDPNSSTKKTKKFPPFVKHFRHSAAEDSTLYKLGDTKVWHNETWHFCHTPNHRDNHKWHPHPPTDCRTRKKWLETDKRAAANNTVSDNEDSSPVPDTKDADGPPDADDLTAMLANALTLAQDNPDATELIANALNVIRG